MFQQKRETSRKTKSNLVVCQPVNSFSIGDVSAINPVEHFEHPYCTDVQRRSHRQKRKNVRDAPINASTKCNTAEPLLRVEIFLRTRSSFRGLAVCTWILLWNILQNYNMFLVTHFFKFVMSIFFWYWFYSEALQFRKSPISHYNDPATLRV